MTALEHGHEYGMAAILGAKAQVEQLGREDRLEWFAGFLTASVACMAASVGEPAISALRELLGN